MNRKERIHDHINSIAREMLDHIREDEGHYANRWVPAAAIKNELELNLVAVPRSNTPRGEQGWLFATVARL
jgi:hypothetical protein